MTLMTAAYSSIIHATSPTTAQSCPAKTTKRPVAEAGERIRGSWNECADAIRQMAEDCAYAKREYSPMELRELRSTLPFGDSMFSKLAAMPLENDSKSYSRRRPVYRRPSG